MWYIHKITVVITVLDIIIILFRYILFDIIVKSNKIRTGGQTIIPKMELVNYIGIFIILLILRL